MFDDGMMRGFDMGFGWGGWFFGPIMMLGFLALIIFGIIALVRWSSGPAREYSSMDNAQSILRERFAAGEIEEEEFKRRLKSLS